MTSRKLLVVGELNIDLILNNIEGFPQIGTEIIANRMNLTLGSSSAILASNISTLGVDTAFCGMIGKDEFGQFVLQELQKKKVDTRYIRQDPEFKTGLTVVMSYEQDRANVTYCGAMQALSMDHIPWHDLQEYRHFHLSNFFLQKGIKNDIVSIFQRAKEAGLSTSLDLQWDPDNQWDFDYRACLPFVDIFLPNEAELLALTGSKSLEEAEEAIRPYSKILAIKMGEKGARVLSGDQKHTIKPFLNKKFVDSIGAGDSFNAGFLQKFLDDAPLEECLQHASLMGSMNTLSAGGTTAFSSKEKIEEQRLQILNNQL